MAYVDKEHDFVVLELGTHDSGVPFPPALTCLDRSVGLMFTLLGILTVCK